MNKVGNACFDEVVRKFTAPPLEFLDSISWMKMGVELNWRNVYEWYNKCAKEPSNNKYEQKVLE